MKKLINRRPLVKHRLNYYTERQVSQVCKRWKVGRKNPSVGPLEEDITIEKPGSVLSRRLLADIVRESGENIEKASTGDPGKVVNSRTRTVEKGPQRKKESSKGIWNP